MTVDLFQTETANYADYVLPAASFLEFDDVVMSYFSCSISAQVKAEQPLGEALPNQEIFRRLAHAMQLTDAELFESDESLIGTLLAQAKPGLDFATLAEVGTIAHPEQPVVQFERHDYRTPSGKIELTGQSFVDAGLPRAPFASAEARPTHGELRLLSPASEWLMNSSYGNDPKILKTARRPGGVLASRRSRGARHPKRRVDPACKRRGRDHAARRHVPGCAPRRHPGAQGPLVGCRLGGQRQHAQSRPQVRPGGELRRAQHQRVGFCGLKALRY